MPTATPSGSSTPVSNLEPSAVLVALDEREQNIDRDVTLAEENGVIEEPPTIWAGRNVR